MQPFLIDTHAHIYLPEFDGDKAEVMARVEEACIKKIYLPAIDSSTHDSMLQTEARFPVCESMMGLHPCSVNDDYKTELHIVKAYLEQRKLLQLVK